MKDHTTRDYRGYGRVAPRVVWPEKALVALNIQINYEEGAEYTYARDGRNENFGEYMMSMDGVANRSMESTFEYGSRVGFWRVMRLLDEHDILATVNACAVAVENNPDVAEYLKGSRHEIACHGYRFEEAWTMTGEEERQSIRDAVASLRRTCGRRPVGWSSRLMPSEYTRALLVEEGGFLYDSDALNDDLPYYVHVNGTPHLVVPFTFTYNDGRFVMGGCDDPDAFARYCCRALDEYRREGATHPKMMTVSLHPRIIGQAGRLSALRTFIEYARECGGVWFAARAEIARWWADHHEEFQT